MFQKNRKSIVVNKTSFNKARTKITSKRSKSPPKDEYLKVIIQTLKGDNVEINQTDAFYKIIEKIDANKHKTKWGYRVKTLALFDRLIEERLFLAEIHAIKIEQFVAIAKKNSIFNEKKNDIEIKERFIEYYCDFIKKKAWLFSKADSYFNKNNDEKPKFYQKRTLQEIDFELKSLQELNDSILKMVQISKKTFLKYRLIQYIYIMFFSFFLNFYSLQYNAILSIIDKFFSYDFQNAIIAKQLYIQFITNIEDYKNFIITNCNIPGIQSQTDFYTHNPKLLTSFDEFISLMDKKTPICNPYSLSEIISDETSKQKIEKIEESMSIRKLTMKFNENLKSSENSSCGSIESEAEVLTQRKKDIFASPVKANFFNRFQFHLNSIEENNSICIDNSKIKKFDLVSDEFCYEIFEKFPNHFSKNHKNSNTDLDEYCLPKFELQVKFSASDQTFFRRDTVEIDGNHKFILEKKFDDKIFVEFKQGFSSDWKFDRKLRSKDDFNIKNDAGKNGGFWKNKKK